MRNRNRVPKLPAKVLWLLSVMFAQSVLAASHSIKVNIIGARASEGQVIGSLFSSKENYLKQPFLDQLEPVNGNGAATCEFFEVPAGRYAVSVVYDEDMDGELDTGFLGIPKEKVGFSNNAKGRFGPPGFDKTSFELGEDVELKVRLTEAKD